MERDLVWNGTQYGTRPNIEQGLIWNRTQYGTGLFGNVLATFWHFSLYRRIHTTSVMQVALFIVERLQSSGALHRYRWMHCRCLENDLVVSQHTVRHLLGILDPIPEDLVELNNQVNVTAECEDYGLVMLFLPR
jgi:hypothetical protein